MKGFSHQSVSVDITKNYKDSNITYYCMQRLYRLSYGRRADLRRSYSAFGEGREAIDPPFHSIYDAILVALEHRVAEQCNFAHNAFFQNQGSVAILQRLVCI